MPVNIREADKREKVKKFIKFPWMLNQDDPFWVPPFYRDELKYFNPKKNRQLQHADFKLYMAYRGSEPVGRIMGLINQNYNNRMGDKAARFSSFACRQDTEAGKALLEAVEKWAGSKGMNEIYGPFGFSDKDPQGLLIGGFDEPAVVVTNHNQPYLPEMLVDSGYKKKSDLLSYLIPVPESTPVFYERVLKRLNQHKQFELKEFENLRQLRPYIRPVFDLINKSYTEIFGFDLVSREEADDFAKQYFPVIRPEFFKAVVKEGALVGFILGIPDFSDAIRKSRGRLFPFGALRIMRSMRKSRKLVLLLGCIHPDFRGTGMDAMMGKSLLETAGRLNYTHIDTHLVQESNLKYRAEVERLGGTVNRRFRIFTKALQ